MGTSKLSGGMGFRDLEVFNLALLAKQCWRLFQTPNSSVAQIMADKYHPNSSLMQASLGGRPSYAWRSILKARPIMERGLGWRVGNGASIKIWGNRWLPSPTSFKVQTQVQVLHHDAKVADLIDPTTKGWKFQPIGEIFEQEEAKLICSLPLCPLMNNDKQVWLGSKSGLFSVKSAYYLEKSRRDIEKGSCSNVSAKGAFWKTLWKLRVPVVLKNFRWKVSNDIIPTKENPH
jgi:hypothetical protein